MQERDYATPTKRKRKRGGFKYSTKKTLARSRMGKRLSRVDEGEAFLTSRTILFKPGDEDTYTDRLGSTPYIGDKTNTERITDTQENSSGAEDEGETQYTREVRLNIQFSLCTFNCKFYTHVESTIDMKVDTYIFCGQIYVKIMKFEILGNT